MFRWWERVERIFAVRLSHLAASLHRNACCYLSTSILFVFLFAIAFLTTFELDFDIERTWTIRGPVARDQVLFRREFGRTLATEVIVKAADGKSVLRPEIVNEMRKLDTRLRAVELEVDAEGREERVKFADVCIQALTETWRPCVARTPLDFFPNVSIVYTSQNQLEAAVSGSWDPRVSPFVWSGDRRAAMFTYFFRDEKAFSTNSRLLQREVARIANDDFSDDVLNVFAREGSYFDEVQRSTFVAIPPLGVGMVIMIIFVFLRLGKTPGPDGHWNFRTPVALIFVIVGAVTFSAAVGALLSLKFTNITAVIAFIALGVGVDDLIVIYDSFYATNSSLNTKERLQRTIGHAGTSIFLTSASSILAFSFGGLSSIPAVSGFCINAALLMMALFVLTLFAFVPVLVFDSQKQSLKVARGASLGEAAHPPAAASCSAWPQVSERHRRFILETYVPLIASRICVGIVSIIVVMLTTGAALLIGSMPVGMENAHMMPVNSDAVAFDVELHAFWGGELETIDIVAIWPALHDSQVRWGMHAIENRFLNDNEIIIPDSNASFVAALERFVAENSNLTSLRTEPEAARAVELMLRDIRFRDFARSISCDPNGAIRAMKFTRLNAVPHTRAVSATYVTSYESMRSYVSEAPTVVNGTLDAFAYHESFWLKEMDRLLISELLRSLIGGNVLVLILLFAFFAPRVALVTSVTTIWAQMLCLASINVWHNVVTEVFRLDIVTLTTQIMATAFALDYGIHASHSFTHCRGTPTERAAYMMLTTGSSILAGGFTTLLGVSMLSWAGSLSFQSFFYQTVSIVLAGLLISLVLLPVLFVHLPLVTPDGTDGNDVKNNSEHNDSKEEPLESGDELHEVIAGTGARRHHVPHPHLDDIASYENGGKLALQIQYERQAATQRFNMQVSLETANADSDDSMPSSSKGSASKSSVSTSLSSESDSDSTSSSSKGRASKSSLFIFE